MSGFDGRGSYRREVCPTNNGKGHRFGKPFVRSGVRVSWCTRCNHYSFKSVINDPTGNAVREVLEQFVEHRMNERLRGAYE